MANYYTKPSDQNVAVTIDWTRRLLAIGEPDIDASDWAVLVGSVTLTDASESGATVVGGVPGEVAEIAQTITAGEHTLTRNVEVHVTAPSASAPATPLFYYGVGASGAALAGLSSREATSPLGAVSFAPVAQHALLGYPTTWGPIAIWVDGLDQTDAFGSTVVTVLGVSYYRFESTYPLTGAITADIRRPLA